MKEQLLLKRRLNIAAMLTLALGAAAATAIYLTATTVEQNSLVNEFRNSKAYRHELEAYGGKLSLVADELTRLFSSLWQGENLAITVASISAAITLLLFRLAGNIPTTSPDQGSNRPGTDLKGGN